MITGWGNGSNGPRSPGDWRANPPAGILRLLIVVIGGLVVLQSTPSLDAPKLAYLAVAGTAFAFSCRAVWRLRDRPMFAAAVPWLVASALLAGLIVLSLPVALAYGTPAGQWLRDAATYGLFAAVPVLALDAAASMRSRMLLGLSVATATIGTLSFAAYWVDARSIAVLPFEAPVLPTASLPTALFVVSLAAAVVDSRRVAWIILGGIALGVFLITGSRSAVLFVAAFPVVVLVAGRPALARSVVASVGIGLVALVFVVVVQGALSAAGRDAAPIDAVPAPSAAASVSTLPTSTTSLTPTPAATPTATLPPGSGPNSTFFGRLQRFFAAPGQDGSIRERVAQYEVAWSSFASSPIVGRGLGHPLVWTRIDGTILRDFTADTPLVLPAKLGILGILWLVVFAVVLVRFMRRLRRSAGVTLPGLALTAWAGLLVILVWSGFAVEDKGFSFSLALLLSLALVEIEHGERQPRSPYSSRGSTDSGVDGTVRR